MLATFNILNLKNLLEKSSIFSQSNGNSLLRKLPFPKGKFSRNLPAVGPSKYHMHSFTLGLLCTFPLHQLEKDSRLLFASFAGKYSNILE